MTEHADTEVAEQETGEQLAIDPELLERRDAALAQVVKFGDPVLKSRASEVTEFSDALLGEVERMIAVMRDGMGVGLAATQLGILRRVLVFQAGAEAEPTAVINPQLEWVSDDIATAEEGCLSIPHVSVDVERSLHARVSGLDIEGATLSLEASGLEARVLQHEIDHLDGILILDRTDREQRRAALRALREGGGYSPSTEIESEAPDDAADGDGRPPAAEA